MASDGERLAIPLRDSWMGPNWILRALAGAGAVVLGLFLATSAGAPLAAALLALLAGAVAVALARTSSSGHRSPEQPVETTGLPPLPATPELLEAVDEPLLIVRNRRVLLANSAARALLGDHIQGVDVRLAIRHPAAAERLADPQSDEAPERVTRTELVGLGDRERRWAMSATLLGDGSRLVHLADRSEAHASEQMRTDFVANSSHELRTPLATLLGFLETLQDESAAEDRNLRTRFIEIMFKEAKRMHRLVDDLISLSRIEAERFSLPRESVQLLPLVEEVRRTSSRGPQDQESTIEVQHGSLVPVVLGDRLQLLQLLQNLIRQCSEIWSGGGTVTIRFEEAGTGHAADERDRPRRRHRARAPPSPHRALLPSRSEPQPSDGRDRARPFDREAYRRPAPRPPRYPEQGRRGNGRPRLLAAGTVIKESRKRHRGHAQRF
jgi:two-component system phosphate regulon sensor histidine kinase PhoR